MYKIAIEFAAGYAQKLPPGPYVLISSTPGAHDSWELTWQIDQLHDTCAARKGAACAPPTSFPSGHPLPTLYLTIAMRPHKGWIALDVLKAFITLARFS